MTMTATENAMIEDGIHLNIPAPVYFKALEWSGRMSPSTLENAMEKKDTGGTMAHVKAAFDGEEEDDDTKAFAFGRAGHCRLLEPERFKMEFGIAQQCQGVTRDGKGPQCSKTGTKQQGGNWYCSSHGDDFPSEVAVISPDDAEVIEAVRKRMFAHPAVNILKQSGGCEVSIAWTCPRTGVKNKTRLDKWIPEVQTVDGGSYPLIVDLKFVRCASERAIRFAIRDYGWARAAAFRQDGMEVLTGKRPRYCLICVEKTPPYEISVPMIGEDTLRGALWDVRTNLALWAGCVKSGKYPGYGDDFMEIETESSELHRYRNTVPADYGV